jgi:hypothetical protein
MPKYRALKFLLLLSFFVSPLLTQAAGPFDYIPMENIPGFEGQATDFYQYISSVYKFGIWAIGIAALLMISIGGYMYITSAGNNSSMEKAKGVITDAIVGLVLALGAYLLLYVINPDLVKITKLPVIKAPVTAPTAAVTAPGAPTPPTIPSGTLSNADAVAKLSAAGVSVSSSGNCSDQNNKSCTSLDGIPQSAIDNIINIKTSCGGSVTVTGGTEIGHQSHGSGLPVVDLSFNSALAQCIKNNIHSGDTFQISKICTIPSDSQYRYNCTYNETAEHLHVAFL